MQIFRKLFFGISVLLIFASPANADSNQQQIKANYEYLKKYSDDPGDINYELSKVTAYLMFERVFKREGICSLTYSEEDFAKVISLIISASRQPYTDSLINFTSGMQGDSKKTFLGSIPNLTAKTIRSKDFCDLFNKEILSVRKLPITPANYQYIYTEIMKQYNSYITRK